MANYLCRVTNPRIPDYMVIKVSVPAGQTLHAGEIVPVKALDTTISDNYQVFSGTQPATADLGLQMALIINDGFETLADGRRPDGQPDYTQYTYNAGEVVAAILLVPGLVFEISTDCITGTPAVGSFLEPTNGSYGLSVKATQTAGTKSSLKMLNVSKNFRMGGQFGYNFLTTVIAMVVDGAPAAKA